MSTDKQHNKTQHNYYDGKLMALVFLYQQETRYPPDTSWMFYLIVGNKIYIETMFQGWLYPNTYVFHLHEV